MQVLEEKVGTGSRADCELSVGVVHNGLQVLMGGQNAVAGGEGVGKGDPAKRTAGHQQTEVQHSRGPSIQEQDSGSVTSRKRKIDS